MREEIKKALEKAISELKTQENWGDFDMPEIEVDYPSNEVFGDYTTNAAMALAVKMKKSPLKIAQEIADRISPDLIEEVQVAPPGHINFILKKSYFQDLIEEINKKKKDFGKNDQGNGQKALLEFISSNPTGPIHLGNGRGGPLGDTLARVLSKSGWKTEREFYVNDWGHQIEILGHSILKDEEAQYRGDYIDDLAEKRDKKITSLMEIGNWAAHLIISTYIKPTCKKLGITFNNWFSEESMHQEKKVDEIIEMIKEKGLAYEKDGAVWYRSTEFGDDKDRVLVKSDGKKTYTATDFAYHKNKIDRGYGKLINIQGADHHKEAEVVKNFVEKVLAAPGPDYILTQFVRVTRDGQEVKMSKRKGVYFALDDLIDEVGRDAVRFIFLSYSPSNHINFDLDAAKERSDKNPVYYVQYAHARISSILRKAKDLNFKFDESDLSQLTHEKELSLMRELAKFPDLVADIAENYEAHKLPFYAMKLADKFHSFYVDCKVLDEKNSVLTRARLNLVNAVKIVLAETLDLMGISAPEKM